MLLVREHANKFWLQIKRTNSDFEMKAAPTSVSMVAKHYLVRAVTPYRAVTDECEAMLCE
jgi:hypothetical protein